MAAAMARRERIFEALALGIWGSEPTRDQVDEAYRLADLVIAADPQTDDRAPAAGVSPAPSVVSPAALSSLIDAGAAAPPADLGAVNTLPAAERATPTAAPASPFPRRFLLFRHTDVSGVSGTGVVAEGAEWTDGSASLRWRGEFPSTVAWDDVELLLGAHGHSGATQIRWIDPESHVGYWPVEGEPE